MSHFDHRPEETRDTTIGKPGWRRIRRKRLGQTSPRAPMLVLDALVESDWHQTWTA